MAYFPLVGGAIGAWSGLTWRQARRHVPAAAVRGTGRRGRLRPRPAPCILTGWPTRLTALLAHVPSKDRLEIMAEPGTGSFAAVAVGLALLTRAASLAALEPSPALLAALYCSSRSVMVIGSRWLPYARRDGLVSAFLPESASHGQVDWSLVAAAVGALGALGLAAAVAGRRGAAGGRGRLGNGALVFESLPQESRWLYRRRPRCRRRLLRDLRPGGGGGDRPRPPRPWLERRAAQAPPRRPLGLGPSLLSATPPRPPTALPTLSRGVSVTASAGRSTTSSWPAGT